MICWTNAWQPKPLGGAQALFLAYTDSSDPSPRSVLIPSARPPPSGERSLVRWQMTAPACGVETPVTKPLWSCATVAMRATTRTARRNLKEQGSTAGHGSVTPARASSLYGGHRM